MKVTDDLMTISALSVLYKIDRRTIARRLEKVKPARVKRGGARTYRFYRRDEVRDIILAPSDSAELAAAYEKLLAVRADILEMKRGLKTREYIGADEYQDEIAAAISVARARYLALPQKLADQIAAAAKRHPKDAKARQAAVQAEWERELDEIERELMHRFTWETAN